MANVVVHKARIGCVEFRSCDGVVVVSVIVRFYDAFGRDAGYALNGVRQSTLGYDVATGRLATMQAAGSDTPFTWSYLAGSDLKSSLVYPNGLTASWTYGNRGELLQVCNARTVSSAPSMTSNNLEVVSQYAYTYDAASRRISCAHSGTAFNTPDTNSYLYNARSELTNATAAVDSDYRYGYSFDDIGNRKTSAERGTNSVYTASRLNQYTAVDDFTPTYDADGNQTVVKTATGIWQITYNGENRPVRWTQGDTVITMSFDRMGRRVTKNDHLFVYNGYLQIANHHSSTSTSHFNYYIWDPTEPVATRPLVWRRQAPGTLHQAPLFYTHDGNKNVSEVIASDGTLAAHYEYAPFGALTTQRGDSAAINPWRFSSEYAEDDTATVYYNYRHYEPEMGRWMQRDPVGELGFRLVQESLMKETVLNVTVASSNWDADDWTIHMSANIVLKEVWQRIKNRGSDANDCWYAKNRPSNNYDYLGLKVRVCIRPVDRKPVTWWFVHAFIETDLCGKKGYFPSEEKVPNPDVDDKGGVVPEPHPEGTGSEKSRCVDVDCPCLDEAKLCEKIKKSESDGSWDGDDWSRIFHNCAHWVDMILKSQKCKGLEEHFPGYNLPPAWPRY